MYNSQPQPYPYGPGPGQGPQSQPQQPPQQHPSAQTGGPPQQQQQPPPQPQQQPPQPQQTSQQQQPHPGPQHQQPPQGPPPQGQPPPPPPPPYSGYPPYPQPHQIPQPYPQYAAPYPYPPTEFYYPPYNGYPIVYPGPPQPYPSQYPRPTYPPGPTNYPTAPPPPWNGQPHHQNDNGHPVPPQQRHPNRQPTPTKGHNEPKRRKIEPRPQPPPNVSNHTRTPPREKKTFSDFRVSRIRVGNFDTEETKVETDTRDSRLRFYIRSPLSNPSTSTANLTSANIAAQSPDRLSVSLHKGSRRIVIPADHLSSVQFNRTEGYFKIEGDGWAAFEEVRSEEVDDSASTSSIHSNPKFIPSDSDPTSGEWARVKVMEIWLDKEQALTEPKWTKGNLSKNIDPSSRFQQLIHVTDDVGTQGAPPLELPVMMTFEELLDHWRVHSRISSLEARNGFVIEVAKGEKLVQLIEQSVHSLYHPLASTVQRLLAMMKDKASLEEELRQVVLGIPFPGPQQALDAMLSSDVNHRRESNHSDMSSNMSGNQPTKRTREDSEMDTASSGKREPSIPEEPASTRAVSFKQDPNAMMDTTPVPPDAPNGSTHNPEEHGGSKGKEKEDVIEPFTPSEFLHLQTPADGLMQTPGPHMFAQEQADAIMSPRDLAGADIGEDFRIAEEETLENDGA